MTPLMLTSQFYPSRHDAETTYILDAFADIFNKKLNEFCRREIKAPYNAEPYSYSPYSLIVLENNLYVTNDNDNLVLQYRMTTRVRIKVHEAVNQYVNRPEGDAEWIAELSTQFDANLYPYNSYAPYIHLRALAEKFADGNIKALMMELDAFHNNPKREEIYIDVTQDVEPLEYIP